MERKVSRGKQKIEMKLVESKEARYVAFSKRKASLFKKADELSTLAEADVGVFLFSPSGKPYSYGSISIEKIIDKFLQWKLDNPQLDVAKSNVFQAFDNICEELQVVNEEEESRKRRFKILYPDSEIPPGKHRLEQLVALKLQLDNIKKEAKSYILAERSKFDLNVVPKPDEGESSGTH
ncbi:agamous-like MADS-box protein AGL29 [Lycium ferocissimum]|uniref:agamous-like MADS-box protein AGL29 n=1 Tax=Lycium ferocissimum TaxID=112874 RepID=UPI00281537A6|nr:agamous-like MADS-box protein AGL29 [Lycium ferocissimum]